MAEKRIIIIGAGVAGLATGCYAQMNGYSSHIFEMHDLPGGLCTAWERRGYVFDGCIHYLYGSGPGQPYYRLWEELGAVQDRPMIDHDAFMRVVGADGRTLTVYCNPDRLEAELIAHSPADAALSRSLAQGVRRFASFDMSVMQAKPRSMMSASDGLALGRTMLPYTGPLLKWGFVSAQQLAARFHDPFLRRAVAQMFGWPEMPVMAGLSLLAYMHSGNAGFPTGGSLAFARAIEQRYLALGGRITYKAQVERILTENDRAVGVRLYDNSEHRADVVISAADGRATIFDMLDGRYANRAIRARYAGSLPMHTQMQISLGVDRDMSAAPHWATYLLDEPLLIAGEERREIAIKQYGYDPTLAPPGKSVVEVMLRSEYNYWQRIYGRKLYDIEQLDEAQVVLAFLEKLYPGILEQIEASDVATPLSYERYTGNWQGATSGWLLTPQTMRMMIMGVGKTLPGLRNFYMAGQWVEPGGSVALAAMSGRNVLQLICGGDGKPFHAETPPRAAG